MFDTPPMAPRPGLGSALENRHPVDAQAAAAMPWQDRQRTGIKADRPPTSTRRIVTQSLETPPMARHWASVQRPDRRSAQSKYLWLPGDSAIMTPWQAN